MTENFSEFDNLNQDELNAKLFEIEDLISHFESSIKEEEMKFKNYRTENERRQHNYIPLIFELLKNMAEENMLEDIYENARKEEEKK